MIIDFIQYLQEQLEEDIKLLKEYDDKLRYEGDPRERSKCRQAIKEIKKEIIDRTKEIEKLSNNTGNSLREVKSDSTYRVKALEHLSLLIDEIEVVDKRIDFLGRGQHTEPVVSLYWQERVRLCLSELQQQKDEENGDFSTIDNAIIILLPRNKSTRKIRALAVFILQTLIEEKALRIKDEVFCMVLDAALDSISEIEIFAPQVQTTLSAVFCSLRNSPFKESFHKRLLQKYVRSRNITRREIGVFVLNVVIPKVPEFKKDNASYVIESLVKKLIASYSVVYSVEDRVYAALQLTEALFRLQCQKVSNKINNIDRTQQRKIASVLLEISETDVAINDAVSTVAMWALVWLTNATLSYSSMNNIFTESELDRLRKIAIDEKRDAFLRKDAVLILSISTSEKTVFAQANWFYEWAVIADGKKSQRELPRIVPLDCPKEVNLFKKLIYSDLPIEVKSWVSIALGRQGYFIYNMVEPLLYIFRSDLFPTNTRDEALVYLVFTGGSRVISALIEGANSLRINSQVYPLPDRCFLGLIGMGNVDALEHLSYNSFRHNEDRFLAQQGHNIHKIKAKDCTGKWAYYFVYVEPHHTNNFTNALDSDESVDLEDYGKVVGSCYGEKPDAKLRTLLKEKYGFEV